MRAILVLAAAPMLIGIAASLFTQDARRASLLAALGYGLVRPGIVACIAGRLFRVRYR